MEDIIRGYAGELQDFLECIKLNQRPESDFELAKETLMIIYAAYLSAEIHEVVNMDACLD